MRHFTVCALAFLATAATTAPSLAQDAFKPTEHFKIERPADLKSDDANAIYDGIIKQMAEGYAQSGIPAAKDYLKWRRDNNAPYLSSGHGNRFLNNYGNAVSNGYLKLRRGSKMPVGSVLAKDSFTVTDDKEIFGGALFLMEKLADNAKPQTGDWRYVMIMPDGSIFGDNAVAGDESMQFCHDCHKRVKTRDYLYLIPQKFRATH